MTPLVPFAERRIIKMQNIIKLSDGTKINIHFVYNAVLNLVDDFKFK